MSDLYRLGVGIMMLSHNGKIFIAERIRPQGAWQMPQGGIDENESPKDALYREAMEEIGTNNFSIITESQNWHQYDFPLTYKKKWFTGRYRGQKQKWFLLKFLGNDSEININFHTPEFVDWKWIDSDKLESIIVDFKKLMYKKILEEFKPIILKS